MNGVEGMIPSELDNAKVIFYTDKDFFGTVNYTTGEVFENICYLAICAYPNATDFYLFYCNGEFEVITDTLCDSIEDCMEIANHRKNDIAWRRK